MSSLDAVLFVAMFEAIMLNQKTNEYLDLVVYINHCIFIELFFRLAKLLTAQLPALCYLSLSAFKIFPICQK